MSGTRGDETETPTDVGVSVLARVALLAVGLVVVGGLVTAAFWLAGNV